MDGSTSLILQQQFRDLYIGHDFCDVSFLGGATTPRVAAPHEWEAEIEALRVQCKRVLEAEGDPEFRVMIGKVAFRVTQLIDLDNRDLFFLRRSAVQMRRFPTLGFAPHVVKALLGPNLTGLVLISGSMGAGKTSTAYSYIVHSMTLHGGLGVLIEDPPEGDIAGEHGDGRIVQIRATAKTGGYKTQIRRALRTGARLMMLGEIRDTDTALAALEASINGHLIVATIHADSIIGAIERMQTFCKGQLLNTDDILASGLSAVIFQDLQKVQSQAPGGGLDSDMKVQSLILTGENSAGIRAKIRDGKLEQMEQDIRDQHRSSANQMNRLLGGSVVGRS